MKKIINEKTGKKKMIGKTKLIANLLLILIFAQGVFAQDFEIKNDSNSFFYINGTTGKIGVGTKSPNAALYVTGNINVSGDVCNIGGKCLTNTGTGNGTVTSTATANYIPSMSTSSNIANSNIFYNSTTGSVGIGTPSPSAPLETYKDGSSADTTGGGFIVSRYNNAGNFRGGSIYSRFITGTGDSLVLGVTGVDGKNPFSDFDQARMVISNSGNIGIGTTNPSKVLDIVRENDANIRLAHDATYYAYIQHTGLDIYNNAMQLKIDGSEKMRISTTGNVGIGTTSPSTKLHVNGTINATNIVLQTNCADNQILKWSGGVGTCGTDLSGSGTVTSSATANYIPYMSTATNLSNSAIYQSGSNIGIGTTAPNTTLHVNGPAGERAIFSAGISFISLWSDTNPAFIWRDIGDLRFGTASGYGALGWSEKMRINSTTGNVGIGTGLPINKLEINGNQAAPATGGTAQNGIIRIGDSSNTPMSMDMGVWGTGGYSWIQSRAYNNYATNYVLSLNPNGGNVGIGTTIPLTKLQVGIDNVGEPATLGSLTPQTIIMGAVNDVTETSLLRFVRPTYSGVSYPASVDFKMKAYGALGSPYNPKTQLTIGLKASASYNTGDVVDVLTLRDNGNVGIGTTSPLAKLDVNGTISGDADYLFISRYKNLADGFYEWNSTNGNWTNINPTRPSSWIQYNGRVAANFVSYGLYIWNGSGWPQINGNTADLMTTLNGVLYLAYPNGIWRFDLPNSWTQINTANPITELFSHDGKLYCVNSGVTYRYVSGTTWVAVSDMPPVRNGDMIYRETDRWVTLPRGTAGQVLSMNTTVPVWSSVLIINTSTGNVGIGTTTPTQKLHVNGTINVSNITLQTNCANGEILKWSGGVGKCGTDSGIGSETDPIWSANYTARTGTGNVVYNNSPTITSPTILTGINLPDDSVSEADVSFSTSCGSTSKLYISGGNLACNADANSGGTIIGSATANYIPYMSGSTTNIGTSNVYYNSTTGAVGIGTTTPTQKLDVAGNINMSVINANLTGTGNMTISASGGSVIIVI